LQATGRVDLADVSSKSNGIDDHTLYSPCDPFSSAASCRFRSSFTSGIDEIEELNYRQRLEVLRYSTGEKSMSKYSPKK
jgi:hypothetical protein